MDAQHDFGARDGHRPALLPFTTSWTTATAYQAELSAVDEPVLSGAPVLQHEAQLPDSWWNDLAGTLEKVSAVSADRVGVRQQYMGRAIPEFVGLPAPVVSCWATARADVHRASLTEPLRQVFLQNYRIGERAHVRANNATAMPACRPQLSRSSRPAS